ncbi:MAG TPA: ABC transporter substrate-binding protein [Chloroflexi bacterium]|jgi:NitT/TauT family transport system substrate-binding protein|nr:ABC transporter substrate-binding protein [Chloroflexota bacterium]
MKSRVLLCVALLLVLAVVGCSPRAEADMDGETRQVTIAMGFVPNVQFAPMYVAIERGYFAEEGIEVVLDYGLETDLLQRVGTNDLQFAIANGDQVILARANDLPVTYVLNWYRHFPVCVVSLAESGITTPEDLIGKTVGIPATEGASYIGWLAFLDAAGIAPDEVNLQVIGYTQVASLVEGRVDAAICYAQNEPVQLRESGYELNLLDMDDYTQLVSAGIVTNEATIAEDPALVQGITRAFVRGLEDAIADPDAAFDIARRAIPEMDDATATLQRAVLQESIAIWRSEQLGHNSPAAWAESVDLMHRLGLLTSAIDPEVLYTNRFVAAR